MPVLSLYVKGRMNRTVSLCVTDFLIHIFFMNHLPPALPPSHSFVNFVLIFSKIHDDIRSSDVYNTSGASCGY
jgi:hypothetical protein